MIVRRMICPLPYWTPPPFGFRTLFCCIKPTQINGQFRFGIFFGVILLSYYLVMDVFLYLKFSKTDLLQQFTPSKANETYSPFTHLTIKALMNDPTTRYILSPTAEYFNYFTGFSQKFPWISPNIVTVSHMCLGFIAGKWAASESLHDRRIAVCLFLVHIWLDCLDGVIYRAHAKERLNFVSNRNTQGYQVDIWCDVIGVVFFCFGSVFFFFKRFWPQGKDQPDWIECEKSNDKNIVFHYVQKWKLDWERLRKERKAQADKEAGDDHYNLIVEDEEEPARPTVSRAYFFWRVCFWKLFWCYGLALMISAFTWDLIVKDFREVFTTPVSGQKLQNLQYDLAHSAPTIIIFYLWRLLEGQALIQYFLIPIWMDKFWEFLTHTQYTLLTVIVALYFTSVLYVRYLRAQLGM